jgi:dTDP-glucose pyrophosphorylase
MNNWKKVIIKSDETIRTAIRVLNEESLRIVMVSDEDGRLVGTITDGDIRRGLVKHLSMDSEIIEIMFKNPTVLSTKDSKEAILSKMKKMDILQIPIVDDNGKIVGLETIQHFLDKKSYNNPIFLMAGGFGKRLRPMTDNIPKPLLKIGGKPILESILRQFIDAGFHNFYISLHYKANMIQEYFGNGSDWGVTIKYIYEDKPLGTAGGLGLLPKDLPPLPILMMNGDLLTKVNFEQLLNFHLIEKSDITVCVREYDFQVPYGVIQANGHKITSIKEKPVHKFFVNAGIYVLSPLISKEIDGENYLDMPQLLENKIETNAQVNMFAMHEYWLDIGQKNEFDQAQKEYHKVF